jgi:nucleotide-binding universal stress UspA family protein
MFKRILVALDGSKFSLEAARVGSGMAAEFGAQLRFLTVCGTIKVSKDLQRYLMAEGLVGEPQYLLDDLTKTTLAEARKVAKKAGVSNVKTDVVEGKPARSIVEYIANNKIDLVILGSRGAGKVMAPLLGSTSNKVSTLSDCTCMIVK